MGRGTYVCLDLAADRLAGVEVVNGGVDCWFECPLLPGTLPGGAPPEPARLSSQLVAILEEAGVTARRARVALPDVALLTRVVAMPSMRRRDLRRAAAYAVQRAIPIPAGETASAWTSTPAAGGGFTLRVVAAWRDVVEKLREALAGAGLELELLVPRSAAVASILPDRPALLLEHSGGTVRATALAPGCSPFTGQAPAPDEVAGWPAVLESLVMSARRHLGVAGRDLDVLVTGDIGVVVPAALGARRVTRNGRGPALAAGLPEDSYLAAIGLASDKRISPALVADRHRFGQVLRRQLREAGAPWVPALAAVSIVSWGAAAAGAALLFGWHPSWPLAP